jgi:hypothetical protein
MVFSNRNPKQLVMVFPHSADSSFEVISAGILSLYCFRQASRDNITVELHSVALTEKHCWTYQCSRQIRVGSRARSKSTHCYVVKPGALALDAAASKVRNAIPRRIQTANRLRLAVT